MRMMITKETKTRTDLDFQSGESILIDKPLKWSSFKVVHEIRKTIKVKKVGHAGTLDPLATGLLIICTGKKTKEIYKFQDLEKTYTGTFTLGKTTPSMDAETEVMEEKLLEGLTPDKIYSVRDRFIGKTYQVPPMYSAVKHKGKSLYKLARKGKEVERSPREITITNFQININLPEVEFEITCSKGTYIRVIADDFGKKLGCGAYLSSLRRTKIGEFSVENALSPKTFNELYSIEHPARL